MNEVTIGLNKFLESKNQRELFTTEDMTLLEKYFKLETFERGSYLYEENKPFERLFILLSGEVDTLRLVDGKEKYIVRRYEDDIVNEGIVFENIGLHTTTGIAAIKTVALILDKTGLEKVLLNKDLALKFYKVIAFSAFSKKREIEQKGTIYREEHHPVKKGETLKIPVEAYYGSNTALAKENFQITGIPISHFPKFVMSFAMIKKATAITHRDLGDMDPKIANAIILACEEILTNDDESYLNQQFVVDVIQGGAGTSSNMNANEVIASRANEILDNQRGGKEFCDVNRVVVDSHDHVNKAQSTNDTYPTAIHLTIATSYQSLTEAIEKLVGTFEDKKREFADVIKMGRTQLEDAVPMTMGQEFGSYATALKGDINTLHNVVQNINGINMGATAIGTGANASEEYTKAIIGNINKVVAQHVKYDLKFEQTPDLIQGTWDASAYVHFSGILKLVATKLSKISNDLRLLNSGPIGGFGDITLPAVQPGSSIMPGKVNPVIPEVVNQVCFQVIGNDLTVTMAAEAGQLQLNAFEPVMAFNIFQSLDMLVNAVNTLAEHIPLIEANRERCKAVVESSPGLATFLNPIIGYENAVDVAREVLETKRSVKDIVKQRKLMSEEEWDKLMEIENLTTPNK